MTHFLIEPLSDLLNTCLESIVYQTLTLSLLDYAIVLAFLQIVRIVDFHTEGVCFCPFRLFDETSQTSCGTFYDWLSSFVENGLIQPIAILVIQNGVLENLVVQSLLHFQDFEHLFF